MMSACGKKPAAPADTTAPAQTESTAEPSTEETTAETPSETQVPEDTESSKFFMLQGTITKAEKDGSAFTLLADDGNEYTMLFLISAMWKQRLKRISRLPLPV